MADYGIMFTPMMVQALLAGRKTQTRRLAWRKLEIGSRQSIWRRLRSGDRLWVREAMLQGQAGRWLYAADGTDIALEATDPRVPAMVAWAHHQEEQAVSMRHMPRWASRLTLIVTSTKIEPVQTISEEDAMAEGVEPAIAAVIHPYRTSFVRTWGKIHGEKSWLSNPEVVAISFTVHQGNIDSKKGTST